MENIYEELNTIEDITIEEKENKMNKISIKEIAKASARKIIENLDLEKIITETVENCISSDYIHNRAEEYTNTRIVRYIDIDYIVDDVLEDHISDDDIENKIRDTADDLARCLDFDEDIKEAVDDYVDDDKVVEVARDRIDDIIGNYDIDEIIKEFVDKKLDIDFTPIVYEVLEERIDG